MAIIAICFLGAEFKYDDGFSIFDLSFKKHPSLSWCIIKIMIL